MKNIESYDRTPNQITSSKGTRIGTYLRSEDEEILRYISNNGAFSMVGGRSLWQKMEEERVLCDCSSRGMTQRFERIIMKTIRTYGPE